MRDPLAFDVPTDVAPFPIAHIPAIPDSDYLPILFAFPHFAFPFLLRSRAATPSFAISRRRAADSRCALAFPPLLAISAILASDRLSVRAFPPRAPSACACGFFLVPMHLIILLYALQVKRKMHSLASSCKPFFENG